MVARHQPHYVYSVDRHSSGQYSVRFAYWFLKLYHPAICGGSVEIWRGYARIDTDPIL